MKAIIKGTKVKREYYLGSNNPYTILIWRHKGELDVYSNSDDEGKINSTHTFLQETIIEETSKFTRELLVGECILIGDQEYEINKVAHDVEGNLIYHINHEVIIEDEGSKVAAEKSHEIRRAVLKERENMKLKTKISEDCNEVVSNRGDVKDFKKDKPKFKFW